MQFPPLPCPQARSFPSHSRSCSALCHQLHQILPSFPLALALPLSLTSHDGPFFLLLHTPVPTIITSEYTPDRRFSHSCLRTEPLRKLRLSFIDSSPTLRKSCPISDYILVAMNQGQATIAYRCYNMEMGIDRINEVMDDAPSDSFVPIAMTFARDKLD